ncbi:MAG TPA: TonB-dependent receptor plug domain-containing protein, partial [Lacunisphaera sp.]|nr:TonB-dependent receptor plug domain-containing protein [Lacunisphaera sp.]
MNPSSLRSVPLVTSCRLRRSALLALLSATLVAAVDAQTSAPSSAADAAANDEKVLVLSPFVVNTDRDQGFVAAASLAGGRLGGDLKDTPVAYSVLTREFIDALSLTDLSEMAAWLPNSTENRTAGDTEWSNRDFYLSSRGAGSNRPQRDFFQYGFNFDSYNIERLDYGRGPNSILFGNSSYAGTPNIISKRARGGTQFSEAKLSYGSWENQRVTLDHNQPIGDKFALRVNTLYLDREGWLNNDFEKKKALTIAGTWRVSQNTELRFEAEQGEKEKAALGNHYDDYFSAWNGTSTYSAPASASAAAGVAVQGANTIVYTPSSGENYLVNYQGWVRTHGGNASASYKAGGYTVTGGLANIYQQPISNAVNLPED